jgi:cytochrome c553
MQTPSSRPVPKAVHRRRFLALAVLLCLGWPVQAQDLARGKEINTTCAGCHGDLGQGGKQGEYPRIAGQRQAHLVDQLRAFRARKRVNIPMFPYTQERELPDADIEDVAAYLAQVELPTQWPVFKPEDDALARLRAVESVMIIPRVAGNLEAGGVLYKKECAACHAPSGMGRGKFPRLVGQYTSYLSKQMAAFVKGERPHDEVEVGGILNRLDAQALQDVLAYLTSIQNPQP